MNKDFSFLISIFGIFKGINPQDYQISFNVLGDIDFPDSVLVINLDQNTSLCKAAKSL
jgi:hypothetical protein